MSSQNKNQELSDLLSYVRGEDAKIASAVVTENQQEQRMAPPAAVKERLRQRIADRRASRAATGFFHNRKNSWYLPLAVAASLAIAVYAGFTLRHRYSAPAPLELTAAVASGTIVLNPQQKLTATGFEISAAAAPVELIVSKADKFHIFIKAGEIQVAFDHKKLLTDAWVHTPFGTVVTEGTAFTVVATATATHVNLHEGRIAIYSGRDRAMTKRVFQAPATIEIAKPSFLPGTFPEPAAIERAIGTLNHTPAASALPAPRRVTLLLKNGDSVSGVIVKSDKEHIYLQSKHGMLTIGKNDIQEGL